MFTVINAMQIVMEELNHAFISFDLNVLIMTTSVPEN